MIETNRNEFIDKYIKGILSIDEKLIFDDLYAHDASFKTSVDQRVVLVNAMKAWNNRHEMKSFLNEVHAEIDNTIARRYKTSLKNRVVRFINENKQHFAVASSVALIAVASTFAFTSSYFSNAHKVEYQELSQDLRDIKTYQDKILKGIKKDPNKVNSHAGSFNGSAFVIAQNGYLVTSSHTLKTADSIVIENENGDRYRVTPVFKSADYDLAILKIEDSRFTSFNKLPYSIGNRISDLGEKVFTLGFPRDEMVYGEGALSAQTGFFGDTTAYQISIPVNPGNSGGPLLDNRGNLIGIISGKQTATEGVAFAVKSNFIYQILDEMNDDSINSSMLKNKSAVANLSRTQQIEKLKDLVFKVNVYNN